MIDLLTRTLEEVSISDGTVFRIRTGQPYRSEIFGFTLHDLRYAVIRRVAMGGVDLPTMKELMGHQEISMAPGYSPFSNEPDQRAVEILYQSAPNSAPS